MKRQLFAVALFAALFGAPTEAGAHARSVSYSNWSIHGSKAVVQVKVGLLDENALQATARSFDGGISMPEYLQSRVRLFSESGPCPTDAGSFAELRAGAAWHRFEWSITCAGGETPVNIRSDLLFDVVPSHLHFAHVQRDGEIDGERVLTEEQRLVALPSRNAPESALATLSRFVSLGVDHILSGRDHLVFLFALVLVAAGLREVAFAVTGFTLGHSITLGLTVLGYATPVPGTVEALIGLSIALVAIENVWLSDARRARALPAATVVGLFACAGFAAIWGTISATSVLGLALFATCYFGLLARAERPVRLRWAVAALFGLIHGFGFAGALQELTAGTERLALPLFGFNLGVELGQMAALVLIWPVLLLIRRLGSSYRVASVQWGSAVALALGLFWFVCRA